MIEKKDIIIDGEVTNYIVTSDGRIFNKQRNKELKGTFARNEYKSVQLTIHGKPKTLLVHRLVAEAFCENPNHYNIVDHIDRDKHNNNAENLRWVDNSTNIKNVEHKKSDRANEYVNDLNTDEWKPLFGFKGYVANKEGVIVNSATHRILQGSLRNGYRRVNLFGRNYSVHKLIWETFNGQIPSDKVIDHIDGNRYNNNLQNLRLVEHSVNMKYAQESGHKGQRPVEQYSATGEYIAIYPSIREASKHVNPSEAAIRQAASRGGRSGGFIWRFIDDETPLEEFLNKAINIKKRQQAIGITQYDLEGQKIAHYVSIKEAARVIGCCDSTLSSAARLRRPSKNFYWILDNQDITINDIL